MAPKVLIVDDNAELLGLLSSVFEEAGYVVVSAQRARQGLERAKADKPDVAVVDVLLPDVMGYEVASLLHELKVPFVLVSGVFKGGRHGVDAVQRHGAAAYFEKPFEVDKLIEKVSSLVPARGANTPARRADPVPVPREETVEVDVDLSEPGWELTGRVSITDQGKERIRSTLQGETIKVPASRGPALPVAPPVVAVAPHAPPAGARTGLLRDNLPQLINAFYLAQETGELVLQRGAVRKIVFFEKGAPVFATSNLSTDRFGQFLVRIGKVTPDDLRAAATVAERSHRRTGDVLIEMGLLSSAERMYFVGQQVKAIIYSLFAWDEGQFQLTFQNRARAESLKLDVHPANLVMRGVKKLYSPARLARLLPDAARPIPAQDPAYLLSDVELEGWEGSLLARVDGTRSLKDLTDLSRKPADQVRGLLVGLLSLRILELSA